MSQLAAASTNNVTATNIINLVLASSKSYVVQRLTPASARALIAAGTGKGAGNRAAARARDAMTGS